SGRQLNRRLEEEGLSFKVVRDRTLEHLAVRHLRDGVAVAEIASWLGYSGETAFTRAFRRWHGITPAQFRSSAMLLPRSVNHTRPSPTYPPRTVKYSRPSATKFVRHAYLESLMCQTPDVEMCYGPAHIA